MKKLAENIQNLSEKSLTELREIFKRNTLEIAKLMRETQVAGKDAGQAMNQGNNSLFNQSFRSESVNRKTIRQLEAEIREIKTIAKEKFEVNLDEVQESKSRVFSNLALNRLFHDLEKYEKDISRTKENVRKLTDEAMNQSENNENGFHKTTVKNIASEMKNLQALSLKLKSTKEDALRIFKKTI